MSFETNDAAIDREVYYYSLSAELRVSPAAARQYISRLFDATYEDLDPILKRMYEDGEWGSHIDRAVLSIAVEEDKDSEYNLVERLAHEMKVRPQAVTGVMQTTIEEAAQSRVRMALFDARCRANSDNPTLEQFLSCWT